MSDNEKSFEEAINELEVIVSKLEKGDLSLDESIDVFQKGMELSRYCNKRLDVIEKKISILIERENGEVIEEQFGENDGFQVKI
jgi:exodeoxyribonuclease VII small subunit